MVKYLIKFIMPNTTQKILWVLEPSNEKVNKKN